MRCRTIHRPPDDDETHKSLVHGFTWHTSTDRTAEESSCSSYGSFGGDDDGDVNDNAYARFKQKRRPPPKPIKRVTFRATAANDVHEIESLLDHPELWWDAEELMEIKGDCNVILRQQRKNTELIDRKISKSSTC